MSGSAADRSEELRSLILHDGEVRALRDTGEVTVVRPMRRQPEWHSAPWPDIVLGPPWWRGPTYENLDTDGFRVRLMGTDAVRCPFTPGERRWVKECWTGYEVYMSRAHSEPYTGGILYRADGELEDRFPQSELACLRWRSAVHMPQWASRLSAECASVTVQQRDGAWEWHAVYRRLAA